MKLFATLLIILTIFCSISQAQDKADKTFTIASYNIRYGSLNDSPTAWGRRCPVLLKQIKQIAPDIICMQEVLLFQYNDILAAKPGFAFIGCGRDDGLLAGEFSPILYNTSRFAAAESGVFWLSTEPETPGSMSWETACTRICTWARLIDQQTGKGFYVFNTHLDHRSEQAQTKGIELIKKRIAARNCQSDPYILTGDFNAYEDSKLITTIRKSLANSLEPLPFLYPYRQIHPEAENVASFNGFSNQYDKIIIDYIFTALPFKTLDANIEEHKVDNIYPSDHFPVWAKLMLDGK